MPEAIKLTRFNYFQEKQEKIIQDFQQFLNSKTQNADPTSSEPETLPEEIKTVKALAPSNQTSESNLISDTKEIQIKYLETKSQSTPNIRIKQDSHTNLSPSNIFLKQRHNPKLKPDIQEKLKKHQAFLESIAQEKEQNLIKKLKKIETISKKIIKTTNSKSHEKFQKIKEKHKEQQDLHEQLIQDSNKKLLEADKRIKEKRNQKLKEQSTKSKFHQKDLIENKKKLENEKDVERHVNYFNKVLKINEIRKKAEDKFNDKAKTPRFKLGKLNHESKKSDDWVLKTDRDVVLRSPRSDNEKEEKFKRQITKKELNRLIVDTRISRNKFRMVGFM